MGRLIVKDIMVQKWKMLFIGLSYSLIFSSFLFRSLSGGLSVILVAITYIFTTTAVVHDDKNHSDILLNSLPLLRKKIVRAKYVSIFVYFILGLIEYFIVIFLIDIFVPELQRNPVTWEEFFGAIFATTLLHGIFYPIYFKYGYMKTRFVNMILLLMFFLEYLIWLAIFDQIHKAWIGSNQFFNSYLSKVI